jgi:AGZA family xanthine/uracil permease-like MFS transporter
MDAKPPDTSPVTPPSRQSELTRRVDDFFEISKRGSTIRTELIAGGATFLTMAYILVVNPQILTALPDSEGITLPFDGVVAATALVAGVLTLAYAFFTNYPFAMAAGLGLNAFVAFTLVAQAQLTWPQAMGVIVVEGLVIAALVLTGFREAVLNAIPMDLKRAIGIGIGLFIAFIGLDVAGVVVHPEAGAPIVTLNQDLTSLPILTFAVGLAITMGLVARRIRGALLIGIVLTTIVASIINAITGHPIYADVAPGVRLPRWRGGRAGDGDRPGPFGHALGLLRHDGDRHRRRR